MEFQKYNVKKKKRRRRKIKRENKQTNKNNVAKIIKKIQAGERRGVSRVVAGFSSFDREYSLPHVLAHRMLVSIPGL